MDNTLTILQNKLKDHYRKLCIMENACTHDLGYYNQNYDQRRAVYVDMFFMLEMGIPEMDDIDNEVNQYQWTQVMNKKGQISYEKVITL